MDRGSTQRTWDVIVIGAGPAGAMCGRLLARSGLDVLLVERQTFPRSKVCGGCLNGHALGVLRRAGVLDGVLAAGAREYSSMTLSAGGRRVNLRLPGGVAISRFAMDGVLALAAANAGCSLLTGTAATVRPCGDSRGTGNLRQVLLESPGGKAETVSARIVIAADGLARTSLRTCAEFKGVVWPGSRVGIGALADPGTFPVTDGAVWMAVGRRGYVGAVRVEGDRVNVAAAVDATVLKERGPEGSVTSILSEAGVVLPSGLDRIHWQGTPPLTQRIARPVGHRLLVVGDASGYVEPFTGEGMAWALTAAETAATFAHDGCRAWGDELERRWLQALHETVGRQQRWCRIVSRGLRYPGVVRALVAALRVAPDLAQPVLRHLTPGRG